MKFLVLQFFSQLSFFCFYFCMQFSYKMCLSIVHWQHFLVVHGFILSLMFCLISLFNDHRLPEFFSSFSDSFHVLMRLQAAWSFLYSFFIWILILFLLCLVFLFVVSLLNISLSAFGCSFFVSSFLYLKTTLLVQCSNKDAIRLAYVTSLCLTWDLDHRGANIFKENISHDNEIFYLYTYFSLLF